MWLRPHMENQSHPFTRSFTRTARVDELFVVSPRYQACDGSHSTLSRLARVASWTRCVQPTSAIRHSYKSRAPTHRRVTASILLPTRFPSQTRSETMHSHFTMRFALRGVSPTASRFFVSRCLVRNPPLTSPSSQVKSIARSLRTRSSFSRPSALRLRPRERNEASLHRDVFYRFMPFGLTYDLPTLPP